MPRIVKPSTGFTLIEIMVAMVVFAVVALMAYTGLDHMVQVKQRMEVDNRKWHDLTMVLTRIEEDFSQAANRQWRDEGGTTRAAVWGEAGSVDGSGAQLELVRFDGDHLVHIGYRLTKDKLELLLWNVLDRAPRTVPVAYPLLSNVSHFDMRYIDAAGNWQLTWPLADTSLMPRAVEVTLALDSGESITRLFVLP